MKTAMATQTAERASTAVRLSTGPSAHYARGRKVPMSSVRATSSVRMTCIAGMQARQIDKRIPQNVFHSTAKMMALFSVGQKYPHRM